MYHTFSIWYVIDFIKVVKKFQDLELKGPDVSSIAISAAITAYARIHIFKLKLDILKQGGDLYFSDVNSLYPYVIK